MLRIIVFAVLLTLIFALHPGSAQIDTCPAMVQAALTATNDACQDTGRNQACYGNVRLQATPQSDVSKFTFQQQGDKVEVASIKSLSLSSFDAKKGEWGVALLRLQANIPDTLPGQNVTLVLFGNVQLQNAVPEKSALKPMQAFYFQSGVGDAPCAEAPSSGILIQTPKGAGKVNLTVNGADIALGSTAYLQAQPGKAMTVAVLEGHAEVTAQNVTQVPRAGMMVSIPLDATLNASAAPTFPQPYSDQQVQALPVSLLERPITVAAPQTVQTTVTPTVCTVSADKSVNLRSGPGTNYPKAGSLASGESATPNGQAKDSAGVRWWRLSNGKWVRSDVVQSAGDCASVSVVADIPVPPPTAAAPPSTSAVTQNNAGCSHMMLIGHNNCTVVNAAVICAGQVILNMGIARHYWGSCADAEAAVSTIGLATFSGDGPAPTNYRLQGCHWNPLINQWGVTTYADVTLSPGTYTYTSSWYEGESGTCTFTVK